MIKNFTEADLKPHGAIKGAFTLFAQWDQLIDAPLPWQTRGLQETASGYGKKLTMRRKISFAGRTYRLYRTCFSNSGSVWFIASKRKIFVH